MSEESSRVAFLTAIALLIFAVFLADYFTPLGIAVWVFYLIPVTLSLWLWNRWLPPITALVTTVFIVVGFLASAEGMVAQIAQLNRSFGLLVVWVMAIVGYYFIGNRIAVRRQQWLQGGRTGLNQVMAGDQTLDRLAQNILNFLADYLSARVAVFYAESGDRYRREALYGAADPSLVPEFVLPGEGLTGQAIQDRRPLFLDHLPRTYLRIGSALGEGPPQSVIIAPAIIDQQVLGVIELGFVDSIEADDSLELLTIVSDSISIAIRSAKYRANLRDLLEETQRQAEELQVQSEELRVSNEELEEQSRALEESQSQLEQQQFELEQTNSQLEEQAQLLESQRDELASNQAAIEAKSREVEKASRYKSDFLASMSHELRTPLNSSLILARLLADNPTGNLTADQVTSAETILSSGNDLLTLINDILDLSKIEAGRMELRVETVWLRQMLNELEKALRPVAEIKGLQFAVEIAPGCPDTLETDRQRVEQILKNLLSNAIKFTEKGTVRLIAEAGPRGALSFHVEDTGIGIAAAERDAIFEAFKQIDSAANRKYSGTGLGLSISQKLAKLLGGEISLESEVGQGSTFTVRIPEQHISASTTDRADGGGMVTSVPIASPMPPPRAARPASEPAAQLPDDRQRLTEHSRVILIVEDDPAFARVMSDLAHQLQFQCLMAATADDAISLALQYIPSGVVLDLGLPDHSGLSVLDRLKHDSRTRHIPVHVVSASDAAETALALGAVGYLVKPVQRDTLVAALRGMEDRLMQRMRRVLIVEDDAVQLSSLQKLIGSQEVETIGARSAAECLALLKDSTFDCMVLDLSLPDASGYSLLETISQEDGYSFPPVIVYTGRDLNLDEEHRLRKYSSSIIIKGAKSPERLLDEVTLFLHQVVADLPVEQQRMIRQARSREAALEGRRILVVEDDVRNIFALTSVLEPRGAIVEIARNGREALNRLDESLLDPSKSIDLVLMDVMMPEMDGLTATEEIRKRQGLLKLPIIILTAKAMKEDQETCLAAGANDYIAKPLDVDKLLSLVRVWIRR